MPKILVQALINGAPGGLDHEQVGEVDSDDPRVQGYLAQGYLTKISAKQAKEIKAGNTPEPEPEAADEPVIEEG